MPKGVARGSARKYGLTFEERVWKHARQHFPGEFRVGDVVAAHDVTPAAASHVLRRLVEKGSVVGTGYGWQRRYRVTTERPFDLRGTAPGTLAVLAKHTVARHNPNKPIRHRSRFSLTELDRAWKMT